MTTVDLLARLDSDDGAFDECMFHMAIRAKLIYAAVGGSSTLRTYTRALRCAVGAAARAAEVDTLAYLVLTRAANSGRQAVSLGASDEQRAHAVFGACVELMTVVFADRVTLCDVRAPDVELVEAIGGTPAISARVWSWSTRCSTRVAVAGLNTVRGRRPSWRVTAPGTTGCCCICCVACSPTRSNATGASVACPRSPIAALTTAVGAKRGSRRRPGRRAP